MPFPSRGVSRFNWVFQSLSLVPRIQPRLFLNRNPKHTARFLSALIVVKGCSSRCSGDVMASPRPAFADVAELVLAVHHPADTRSIFALKRAFCFDDRLLRVHAVLERPGTPSRLIAAARARCGVGRAEQLVRVSRPDVLRGDLSTTDSPLHECVRLMRLDLVNLLLECSAVQPFSAEGAVRSAFAFAGQRAADASPAAGSFQRQRAALCVLAMTCCALHPLPDSLLDGSGPAAQRTALWVAVQARLPTVVAQLLADPRLTAQVVNDIDSVALMTPFAFAASFADRLPSARAEECGAAAACARLLALSGRCSPTGSGALHCTNLWFAAAAGLTDVVTAWLAHSDVTAAVVDAFGGETEQTAFSAAASLAVRQGPTREEQRAGESCASLIAASGKCSPVCVTSGSRTHLSLAASAGLTAVVREWLKDDEVVFDIVNTPENDGHTCFSAAAAASREHASYEQRKSIAACARLLTDAELWEPRTKGGDGASHLSWAAHAGLSDVVTKWLGESRVSATVVAHLDSTGHSAFSRATRWACDNLRQVTAEERSAAAGCARQLALSSLCDPASCDENETSNFSHAARAGLCDIVARWLVGPRVTAAVLNARDGDNGTSFSYAVQRALEDNHDTTSQERVSAAECARLIARSGRCDPSVEGARGRTHFGWSTTLLALAEETAGWMGDPRVTSVVIGARDDEGNTVFSAAARNASLVHGLPTPEERAFAATSARRVALSWLCDPASTDSHGVTHLCWAAQAGLTDVVSAWLGSPRVTPATLRTLDKLGMSPLTRCADVIALLLRNEDIGRGPAPRLAELESYKASFRLLALSRQCDPGSVNLVGTTHLMSACSAGMSDVVDGWLKERRVTAAVVNQTRSTDGHNAFSVAAGGVFRLRSTEMRTSFAQCAHLLAHSGLCDPSAMWTDKDTNFSMAASAGLSAVVARWMTDPRVTPTVVDRQGRNGKTAFEDVATKYARARTLADRASLAECARLLACSGLCDPSALCSDSAPHFSLAAEAGLSAVVERWLTDPRVTPAVVACEDDNFVTAFERVVRKLADPVAGMTPADRASLAECARLLAGRVDPSRIGADGLSNKALAGRVGLPAVMEVWEAAGGGSSASADRGKGRSTPRNRELAALRG